MTKLKRIVLASLSLTLVLTCGCISLFERDYSSIEEFTDDFNEDTTQSAVILDYDALKAMLEEMVFGHQTRGKFRFIGYEGDINADISRAVNYIKFETALGAFYVDVIYYDPIRIVSYYEADVFIEYKRAREQIGTAIEDSDALYEYVEKAMTARKNALFYSSAFGETETADAIRAVYYAEPFVALSLPEAEVEVYAESAPRRIIELVWNFAETSAESAAMLSELEAVAAVVAAAVTDAIGAPATIEAPNVDNTPGVDGAPDADDAVGTVGVDGAKSAFYALASLCALSEADENGVRGTAYDALCGGKSDDEGIAMAYMTVCRKLEIDCVVVHGRFRENERVWNVVNVGGQPYLIDLARQLEEGGDVGFFELSNPPEGYWRDDERYSNFSKYMIS